MKLPQLERTVQAWPEGSLDRWGSIASRLAGMGSGTGDAFKAKCDQIERAFYSHQFASLPELFSSRIGARALTWLWSTNAELRKATMTPKILSLLLEKQQPRLTRLTLTQLGQIYFSLFDELGADNLASLQDVLSEQVSKTPSPKVNIEGIEDPVSSLKRSLWLLEPAAAQSLVSRARDNGQELELVFSQLGLKGFDKGRFGDVCRAIYYLETLKTVPLGQWDPVMDELVKSSVNRAPYQSGQWIGHAALEIIIDRVEGEASSSWQKFVLDIAGDPRLAQSAKRYQDWWRPLGEDRIAKVRGWLSREDLKLFLQAVEEYGKISGDTDLQRMFPARKKFLEGLYEQKMVRETRLMLGPRAKVTVQKILKGEIQVSFANLRAQLQDKAIIYLDCGDFYLVEGSHSFKLWVYLAKPGVMITDWGRTYFDHSDLTAVTPRQYTKMYGGLPYVDITHNGMWQKKVFEFLGEHGIRLDVEHFLDPAEYTRYLPRFGVPYVHNRRTEVPEPNMEGLGQRNASFRHSEQSARPDVQSEGHLSKSTPEPEAKPTGQGANKVASRYRALGKKLWLGSEADSQKEAPASHARDEKSGPEISTASESRESREGKNKFSFGKYQASGTSDTTPAEKLAKLSVVERLIIEYLAKHPGSPARYIASTRGMKTFRATQLLTNNLRDLVTKDGQDSWRIQDEYVDLINVGAEKIKNIESDSDSAVQSDPVYRKEPVPQNTDFSYESGVNAKSKKNLSELNEIETTVLDYLAQHPGSPARSLIGVTGLLMSNINELLYGSLRTFLTNTGQDSWNVKLEYAELLD